MTVSTHKAQLEIGADGSQAINEFGRVQAASGKMAEGVKKAGTEASGGLDSVAKGAEASANKMTRAERSIVSSIQRVTAQAQAAGKQSAAFENLIDLRGLDRAKFEPYLQGLRQAEVQTQSLGNTAKQTTASLRQVPAQLTDIVVSLQGGQAPMTVLLQQGGQLKDMFGGIGPAARALGGYVMGMVNPFTAAAAAGATLAVAAYQGAQESKAFAETLITTGNQAGVTAGRLMLMAQSLDSVAGTQGNAAAVLNQLAATGQVTAAGLQLAAQAAIEFERAGGQAAEKTVAGFAELGKAPLAATIKLNESMGYLTRSTYEQIKSLEEQGRTADAAALAQKAFADALLTRAPEMLANMGYLETGWVNIKDAVKEAWDGIKNIGRDAGVEGESAAVGAAIARLEGVIRTKAQGGYNTQMFDAELAKLRERQSILQSDERLLRSAADHQAQQTREVEARVKWDKDGAQYLDKRVKMEREITQAISEGTKAKATQAEIDARVAAIREKYKEKAGPKDRFVPGADNAREWETYMKAFGAAAVDAEGKVSGLTKTQGKLIEYLGSGAYLNMPEPARQTALQAAYAAIATEQQVEATKHQAQAWTEANKAALAYGKQLDDMALAGADLIAQATSYAAAIDQQVAATEFEASLIGQSNVQRGIALKQYQIELDTKKEIARINATLASQADRDAAISAVKAAGDKAKASAAAEVVNQEFNRVSAQIEQSLTDALMRGFESGKGFAETLRDTVANMFKTLVLRPIVSAVVNPMAGAITAGLGLPGAAGAQGGNMLGAVNTANSLYTAYGAAGKVGGFVGSLGSAATYGTSIGSQQGAMLAAQEMGMGTLAGGAAQIGAYVPHIAAFIAVASLIKSLDDSGTMHTGGIGGYSAAGGTATGAAAGLRFGVDAKDYTASAAAASAQVARSIVGMLDSTATTFGQKAGYYAATAFADDTSKDGAWGALMLKIGDKLVLDWANNPERDANVPRVFANGEAGAKEYAVAVAKDVRDYLITQTPAWADTMLTALGDAPSLEQLAATVGQINATATALEGMGRASAAFAGMAEGTASALIASMGGAESAVSSLSGYYTNFYTESERTAVATATLTGQLGELGQALPASREAFRGLVDAAVAAGDTKLAAGLINLQDDFAALVPAAEDAAAAIAASIKTLGDESKRLQRDLLAATGGDVRGFDTSGMSAAEVAIYDYNQSLRDQIAALTDASDAAKRDVGLLTSYQDKYDIATGKTSQWDIDLRDALAQTTDQAVRDLIKKVFDLQRPQPNDTSSAGEVAQAVVAQAVEASADTQALWLQSINDGIARVETATRESITALTDQLTAVRANTSQTVSALNSQASEFDRVAESMKSLMDSILGTTSAISPEDKLAQQRAEFESIAGKAMAGDMSAAALLPTAANALLNTSEQYGTSANDYARDQARAYSVASMVRGSAMSNASDLYAQSASATASGSSLASSLETQLQQAQVKIANDLAVSQAYQSWAAQKASSAANWGYNAAAIQANPMYASAEQYAKANNLPALFDGPPIASSDYAAQAALAKKDAELDQLRQQILTWVSVMPAEDAEYAKSEWRKHDDYAAIKLRSDKLGLPFFDVGTDYVPRDMLAVVHRGEQIVPAPYNPHNQPGGKTDAALIAELSLLRAEVSALRSEARATAINTRRLADLTDTATDGGRAMLTEAYE